MALTDQSLDLIRGDSKRYKVTVVDGDGVEIDLTVGLNGDPALPAVLKFSVKANPDEPNSFAVLFKASYDAAEIEVANQVTDPGVAYVSTLKEDTYDLAPDDTLRWDIELFRQGDEVVAAGVGTIEVTVDSGAITGTGTAFANAKVGDILVPAGGTSPNQIPIVITEVTSATVIVTDYTGWDAEAGISFDVKRGDSKTVAQGPFELLVDQTR